ASLILVGSSTRRLRRRWFGRGLGERLLAAGAGLEVSVLDAAGDQPQTGRRARIAPRWRDYLLATVATDCATLISLGLARVLELPNISL
ncbi:hypothetical protein, partial [Escherichia coli]|uniref:hypothetical protein n=1 Tax=Escherichia coli TaxID=562 RepID=UPI0021CA154C